MKSSIRLVWPYLERLIFALKRCEKTYATQQKESPDAIPAQILWVELATRIATQPLHYRSGEEETAAESVYLLFPKTRALMEQHPDAKKFCEIALKLLNGSLRPYTARWHRWMTEVPVDGGSPKLRFRDELARRMFRTELRKLQPLLLGYEAAFKALSEGSEVRPEWLKPDQATTAELRQKWKNAAKKADLVEEPLEAGIGPQVTVWKAVHKPVCTADIDQKEREFIFARRKIRDPQNKLAAGPKLCDAIGLALSGGGIRSATVCLGVVQVLARKKLLPEVDYLSTVSGGGYFGSFLSSCLGADQMGKSAVTRDSIDRLIAKTFEPDKGGAEAAPVRHLRNNSKYLLSGGLLGKLKIASLMASGLITNLLMILPVPLLTVLLIWALSLVGFWGNEMIKWEARPAAPLSTPIGWILKVLLLILLFFWMFLPAIRKKTLGQPPDSNAARFRGFWTIATLVLALAAVVAGVLFLLPAAFHGYAALKQRLNGLDGSVPHILSENVLVALLGALPFLFGAGAGFFKRPWLRNLLSRLFVLSGPVFYGWVILFVGAKIGLGTGHPEWQWWWVGIATAVGLLWSWLFVDINTLGPHGYYRDRLCECYLAYRGKNELKWWQSAIRRFWSGRKKSADSSQAPGASEVTSDKIAVRHRLPPGALANHGLPVQVTSDKIAVRQRLSLTDMRSPGAAPYHLLNTVVNLPASANPELRGRNGDFFILSPYFSGSPICGYVDTSSLERSDPHVDLGSAMAISAAAASTNMGWRTLPNFRFLMAVFNVRLGYWIPSVRHVDKGMARGVGPAYFLAEITGRIQENMKYLNISDGGHIENLGVYELLRRRCKFIICVHGGADLGTEGSDLQRLERYALIDLGIKLEYNLADLQPNKEKISRAYAILIKILYSPEDPDSKDIGWMLYLKPAITGAEPQYVLDYRYRNASFPHEGILDQIFEEEQFEGYRAVGECAAESLFRPEIVDDKPETVRAWFQKLANSLLPDNDKAFPDQEDAERDCGGQN